MVRVHSGALEKSAAQRSARLFSSRPEQVGARVSPRVLRCYGCGCAMLMFTPGPPPGLGRGQALAAGRFSLRNRLADVRGDRLV